MTANTTETANANNANQAIPPPYIVMALDRIEKKGRTRQNDFFMKVYFASYKPYSNQTQKK